MSSIFRTSLFKLLVIILPFFPLLEGVLVNPIGNPKINLGINTFSFVHLLFLFILLGVKNSRTIKVDAISLFFVIIIVIYSCISPDPSLKNISYIICVLLSYFIIFIDWDEHRVYAKVEAFMISLAILSIFIMLFRLKMYNFDLVRARSGANIYGANAVFNLYLLFFSYHLLFSLDRGKDRIHFLLMAILAFIFVSKTGIIIILLLLLARLFIYSNLKFKSIFRVIMYLIFSCISVYIILFFTPLGETVLFRFGFDNITNEGLSFAISKLIAVQQEQQRGVLWAEAIKLIGLYPFSGVGIGLYSNFGDQTSAHNLVLNNLAEYGVIFGGLINIFFIAPFFMIIGYKIERKDKIFSLLVYFLFFLQAVLAGQKIIQTSGYISSFLLFIFFAFVYQLRCGGKTNQFPHN
jgi:hypothetical protein